MKHLFTALLLLISIFLKAQTDFRPGFIIQNNGDTLFGEIDYRGDVLMGTICRYKSETGEITKFQPTHIKAYRFTNSKYYISKEINGKNFFLEYLVNGEVNIYYLRDENGDRYFLDKEGIPITEIPYEEGFKYVDGVKYFYESKKHMGHLNYYMSDAPNYMKRIEKVQKPSHKNLIKLAEEYHDIVCNDKACIVYEKQLPLFKFSFEPFYGLVKYRGNTSYFNSGGAYGYLWMPRTNEKLFFKTGLLMHNPEIEKGNIRIYKIPIQVHYLYSAYKLQPKVSFGINLLRAKFNNYFSRSYTFALNAGLNYKISKTVSISTSFNSDFTPISYVISNDKEKFKNISYSINAGLYFEF